MTMMGQLRLDRKVFPRGHDEPIGNVAASCLLSFLLEEIGPSIYNQAVSDVRERLQQRVAEVDIEVQQDEFQYWRKFDKQPKGWP